MIMVLFEKVVWKFEKKDTNIWRRLYYSDCNFLIKNPSYLNQIYPIYSVNCRSEESASAQISLVFSWCQIL